MSLANQRSNNFDFVRFSAAFFVIYGHCKFLFGSVPPMILGMPVHRIGVTIFFSLSGYLVTDSWLRQPRLTSFFAKRCLRIFPALIVVTFLTVLVLGPLMTQNALADYWREPQTWDYLRNARLRVSYSLPGVFTDNLYYTVNGSLWSLPPEFFCYICVAAVGLLPGRLGVAAIMCGAIFLGAANLYQQSHHPHKIIFYATDLYQTASVAVYFFVGAGARMVRLPLRLDIAFVVACFLFNWPFDSSPVVWIAIWLGLPYIVLAFATQSTPVLRNWARFGDFSYGMYLYSFPLAQILAATSLKTLNVHSIVVAVTVLSIGCAFLSWHLIERRALRFKPKGAASGSINNRQLLAVEPLLARQSGIDAR